MQATDEDVSLVLTPTKRLAEQWRQQQTKQRPKNAVFTLPPCLAVSSWLSQIWHAYSFQAPHCPALITPIQSYALWSQIITEDYPYSHIWPTSHTIELAQQAFRFVAEWQLPLALLQAQALGNSLCFLRWYERYQNTLQQYHLLDPAQQLSYCLNHQKEILSLIPSNILCYGFDDLSPALEAWLNVCQAAGKHVIYRSPPPTDATIYTLSAACPLDELNQALAWAQALLPQHRAEDWPIGIVVPDLTARRQIIVESCQAWLDADNLLRFGEKPKQTFNVSGGMALLHMPVIYAAIEALALWRKTQQDVTPIWQFLLATPFISGGEAHLISRTQIRAQYSMLTPHRLQQILSKTDPLQAVLSDWKRWKEAFEIHQPLSDWVNTWLHYLESLGWPGERVLSSEEYQAVQQYFEVCTQLLSVDLFGTKFSFDSAFSLLRYALQCHCFQPQTYTETVPIQVLGILEAAGMQFSHLWVMGLSHHAWPQAANPNPFLPVSIQKKYDVPHASAARELDFATKILDRLKQSASVIILSYPRHIDHQPILPSRLIELANPLPLEQPVRDDPIALQLKQTAITYLQIHMVAPPLAVNTLTGFPSHALSTQAQCPFKAFSVYRLGLESPDTVAFGLSAAQKGTITHQLLQVALDNWQRETQAPSRTFLLDQIYHLLKPYQNNVRLPAYYWRLETERLLSLVLQVLAVDSERPPFQIKGLEKRLEITLGGLVFRLNCDRLDEAADGQQWLIDYKTGACDPNDWLGDRLYDAQMPLYALALEQFPTVLCYYAIGQEEVIWKGLSQSALPCPGIRQYGSDADWERLRETWHAQLTALANDFRQGIASITPRQPERTCQYCHLKTLCRVEHAIDK